MARLEVNIGQLVSIKSIIRNAESNMFLFLTQDDDKLDSELNLLGIEIEGEGEE